MRSAMVPRGTSKRLCAGSWGGGEVSGRSERKKEKKGSARAYVFDQEWQCIWVSVRSVVLIRTTRVLRLGLRDASLRRQSGCLRTHKAVDSRSS